MKTNKTNNDLTIVAKSEIKKEVTDKAVKVVFRVTQTGKNPFAMQTELTTLSKNVTITGLAKKTAFAIADSLYSLCEKSLDARERLGYYLTAFRPKAVFKVEIAVNNRVSFIALNTKGIDAVRLVKKGKLISRSILAEKFELLAEVSKASQSFTEAINFEKQVIKKVAAPKKKTVKVLPEAVK